MWILFLRFLIHVWHPRCPLNGLLWYNRTGWLGAKHQVSYLLVWLEQRSTWLWALTDSLVCCFYIVALGLVLSHVVNFLFPSVSGGGSPADEGNPVGSTDNQTGEISFPSWRPPLLKSFVTHIPSRGHTITSSSTSPWRHAAECLPPPPHPPP